MNHRTHLGIHFYHQYEAAVAIETSADGKEREFEEILLFNCFALRQMSSLASVAAPVAQVLGAVNSRLSPYSYYLALLMKIRSIDELAVYVPLIAALGVDLTDLVRFTPALALARAAAGGDNKRVAREMWPNVARLVLNQHGQADKRFLAELEHTGSQIDFQIKSKGFGILGKGINYYAPMSVILLLKHLDDQHRSEFDFSIRLTRSARSCSQAFLQGKVTSSNQSALSLILAQQANESN